MSDFTGLTIAGRVATPSDADWDEARQPGTWRPTSARAPSPSSRAPTTSPRPFASPRENGLKVAGQGTGHGAVALGPLDDTILIKTERMRGIEVDADAPDGAGRGRRAVARARRSGAAPTASARMPGSSPDVGVVGYTLGGGLSWLGRRHGFACNRVSAIELVTADGEPRTVDADNDPTSSGRCAAAAAATRSSPRCTSTCCRSPRSTPAPWSSRPRSAPTRSAPTATGRPRCPTRSPRSSASSPRRRSPTCPSRCAGTPLLTIDGACIGSQEEGEAAIAPLREIGETIMDTFAWMPAAGLSRIHMDPENPVPGMGDGGADLASCPTRRSTPASASPGPAPARRCCSASCAISAAPWAARPRTAAPSRKLDAGFAMFSVGMPMTPELGEAIPSPPAPRSRRRWSPGAADGGYFNFTEAPATSTRSCRPTSATGSPR